MSAAASPARARAPSNAARARGTEGLLAEAVLPLARSGLPGDPPPLEEFVGGGGVAEQGGHPPVGGEHEGHRAVTTLALVGAARQAGAQIGQHGEGRGPLPGQSGQFAWWPSAERTDPHRS